ncbi:MAG: 6-phosphogluconolactonase [Oscillatoriales cyanobacterium SM2_2_1]|nr:6-phosphogluconolactonase [Oscillatoriales cyanobacterium SM2_2_1]
MAIEVLGDRSAIAHRAVAMCEEVYRQAIAARGMFTLVTAGGSTPKLLYGLLAEQNWDWARVHIFFGDERYVSPQDPQSNQGMVRQCWLNHVPIPEKNIHPMPTDEADPAIAADRYAQHLKEFFLISDHSIPVFDLILLGMGDDGHTASLFPGTEALKVFDRLVAVGHKQNEPRLTLTIPVLSAGSQILFLVEGAAKARVLHTVATATEVVYPAQLIRGQVHWLVDGAAAALILEPQT